MLEVFNWYRAHVILFTSEEFNMLTVWKKTFGSCWFKVTWCFILFRLQARYFDPVTQLPYSNLQAFRILREAYYQQLEERGDRNNPEVAHWIEWRQKMKELKSAIVQQINKSIRLEPASIPVTTQWFYTKVKNNISGAW